MREFPESLKQQIDEQTAVGKCDFMKQYLPSLRICFFKNEAPCRYQGNVVTTKNCEIDFFRICYLKYEGKK